MALDESALPELLAALRAGDGLDLIRDAVRLVMQATHRHHLSEASTAKLHPSRDNDTAPDTGIIAIN